ncbi:hypothetical protein BDBG_06547 [Blastomyces gilchristii SLH14081]|uniref:Uncharacterized protein n=1 Tax=Blastomyces gilchristii (strain SLH14081) TaxID=559298 RepID=A0A179USI9_BLAGS|nr:uncharacterized protein BDBG_06547 [Blastomyces gilchristii SLH14081]OAT10743.1 hypothetical protein BDBG_06547 [Blastomyces gilchristii SLH14081]
MAEQESDSVALEERLKSALWLAIGRIVDDETIKLGVDATPQFIGALTEMVWAQIGKIPPTVLGYPCRDVKEISGERYIHADIKFRDRGTRPGGIRQTCGTVDDQLIRCDASGTPKRRLGINIASIY